jgi:hypothetical protein
MSNAPSYRMIAEKEQFPERAAITSTVERLTALAANGLPSMFDEKTQLFCYKLKKTDQGMVREGISHRYTMMTLMGLKRLEESGVASPIAIGPVLDKLLENLDWVNNIGDLGVLLWTCAVVMPERIAEVERRLAVANALEKYPGVREGRTMELAWFLTGLSHAEMARPSSPAYVKDLAARTYQILIKNQGDRGTFGHLATSGSFAGMIRGRIGSFADQVYPIYAMTRFSQAYGDKAALERALDCTLLICEVQGSLGQWWWHYDSSTGRVAGRLPVFSVHQHAMGPMALLALGEVTQSDFTPWIYKGLQWIRRNELALDMEDSAANVVWRSIYRPTPNRILNTALAFVSQRDDGESRRGLKVTWECRPYELGWLLYAFAKWSRQ